MIGQILATLLPVFLIAGSGAAYGRFRTPDIRSLNTLNMELFVPLLVFAVLADRQAPLAEYAWLASAAALVVLGSGLVLWPVVKWLGLDSKVFLPPMMFNNSGNMGVPLLVLAAWLVLRLRGDEFARPAWALRGAAPAAPPAIPIASLIKVACMLTLLWLSRSVPLGISVVISLILRWTTGMSGMMGLGISILRSIAFFFVGS